MPPSPPPPASGPAKKPPTRRNLKAMILWCSRWMLGDGEFYRGRVQVEICAAGEGETLKVVPTKEVSGLAEPAPVTMSSTNQQATPAELLAVLLSRDEMRILLEMLGEGGVKASSVQSMTKITESKFWTLWANLQQRGIVVDAEGAQGDGFVIGPGWVRELVRAKSDGGAKSVA